MTVTGENRSSGKKKLFQCHFVRHMHYHAIKSVIRGYGVTAWAMERSL